MKKILFIAGLLLFANNVSAQVVVRQQSTFSVPASPDHNATVGSTALVDNYSIKVLPNGGTTVTFTRNIGKPTPDGSGNIIAPIGWSTSEFNSITAGLYVLIVTTNGPGGPVDSVPSIPFAVIVTRPTGQPVVIR